MHPANEQEAPICALCEHGSHRLALELALELYEEELARFVMAVLHRHDLAEEAFSRVCEKLVTSLPAFRWESSLRMWLYRVARNECIDLLRSRARWELPVSEPGDGAAQPERSRTNPWLRTEVKDKFRALRERLSPRERALLQLKVDQDLPWIEVAQILWDGEEPATGQELEKRAAALRQQFKRMKDRLKALALEAGLVPLSP